MCNEIYVRDSDSFKKPGQKRLLSGSCTDGVLEQSHDWLLFPCDTYRRHTLTQSLTHYGLLTPHGANDHHWCPMFCNKTIDQLVN